MILASSQTSKVAANEYNVRRQQYDLGARGKDQVDTSITDLLKMMTEYVANTRRNGSNT